MAFTPLSSPDPAYQVAACPGASTGAWVVLGRLGEAAGRRACECVCARACSLSVYGSSVNVRTRVLACERTHPEAGGHARGPCAAWVQVGGLLVCGRGRGQARGRGQSGGGSGWAGHPPQLMGPRQALQPPTPYMRAL